MIRKLSLKGLGVLALSLDTSRVVDRSRLWDLPLVYRGERIQVIRITEDAISRHYEAEFSLPWWAAFALQAELAWSWLVGMARRFRFTRGDYDYQPVFTLGDDPEGSVTGHPSLKLWLGAELKLRPAPDISKLLAETRQPEIRPVPEPAQQVAQPTGETADPPASPIRAVIKNDHAVSSQRPPPTLMLIGRSGNRQ